MSDKRRAVLISSLITHHLSPAKRFSYEEIYLVSLRHRVELKCSCRGAGAVGDGGGGARPLGRAGRGVGEGGEARAGGRAPLLQEQEGVLRGLQALRGAGRGRPRVRS